MHPFIGLLVSRHRLVGLLLGAGLAALAVSQGTAADPVFYTATYVEVIAPAEAQAAALLRQYRDASRQDPGAQRFEVLQRVDRPNQFVVLGTWKDRQAYETHAAAASAREFRDKLQPLVASPNDERLHHALSVGTAPAGTAVGVLHVVTHVDVIPPRKDDAVTLLGRLAENSRKDAGNVRFDVVQQANRPNHFTVVETWQDKKAFDGHSMGAHTRQFREQLAPMSGSLYDERLYVELK